MYSIFTFFEKIGEAIGRRGMVSIRGTHNSNYGLKFSLKKCEKVKSPKKNESSI